MSCFSYAIATNISVFLCLFVFLLQKKKCSTFSFILFSNFRLFAQTMSPSILNSLTQFN